MSIWEKYKNIETIGYGTFGNIYKAQNKQTKNYVAIKEFFKEKSNNHHLKEIEVMKKLNQNNSILKETFETKEYFYIVMEICICNLENYIQMREKGLSSNEIKQILIQINNILKILLNEDIQLRDLNTRIILISLNKIDNILIKLSNLISSNDISYTKTVSKISLTSAPEIINYEGDLSKSVLWSLGILIYYMTFKEYPYYGDNEYKLFEDIKSGKNLQSIENQELNDLMNKLLKIEVSERLSWEEYFNHNFFKEDNKDNFPTFNLICQKHNRKFNSYCTNCKVNICTNCIQEHNNEHNIILFSHIGLNNEEINKIENLFKEIQNKIFSFKEFMAQIKSIKENVTVYENDINNNYKKYYIEVLENINNQLQDKMNVNLIDLNEKDNYIFVNIILKKKN